MATSQNRTKWPLKGGAVSIQPGWFPGHSNAQFYINMGYGNEPLNYSHNAVPVFQITGPSNQQYDGTFCLPQVPLPANYTPQVGDNATIQIIEVAQHGASLYNVRSLPHYQATSRSNQLTCDDSAQTSPSQSPRTSRSQPHKLLQQHAAGPGIGFQIVYATTSSPAPHNAVVNTYASVAVPLMLAAASYLTWI